MKNKRVMMIDLGVARIGEGCPPFIIAEMSGNHGGSLARALEIVDAAADCGAHAIKLQTYTADAMTLDLHEREFIIDEPSSLWYGQSLYELYDKAHTPLDWHEPIFQRAHERGLIAFSTPFDEASVGFLDELGVPLYKIASLENTHLPLIEAVAARGKPVIISTGLATLAELDDAVTTARNAGCDQLVLLKCTSSYPAPVEGANLASIPHMREAFSCEVGVSDHTLGYGAAIASVALGAVAIEKHLTLERGDVGVDSAFSMPPDEFAVLAQEAKNAWLSLGEISYGPTESEQAALARRRSLYIVKDMSEGEVLSEDNVRAIRPGYGLPPGRLNVVMGMRLTKDAKMGTPLTWELLR